MSAVQQVYVHLAAVAELERTRIAPTDLRGHVFKKLLNTDSQGGGWSWIYQCECGVYHVIERKSRRSPVLSTVIATDCPLSASASAIASTQESA